MADWEITATTIFCDAVDDEVTVIIRRDGTVSCTGHQKYARPGKETSGANKKNRRQPGKQSGCSEVECSRVIQCRDRLLKS
jgi:hypothetical protein